MVDTKMPHQEHDKHLCYLVNLQFQFGNEQDYKLLIREPKYYCKNCGRAAASAENLCNPVKL